MLFSSFKQNKRSRTNPISSNCATRVGGGGFHDKKLSNVIYDFNIFMKTGETLFKHCNLCLNSHDTPQSWGPRLHSEAQIPQFYSQIINMPIRTWKSLKDWGATIRGVQYSDGKHICNFNIYVTGLNQVRFPSIFINGSKLRNCSIHWNLSLPLMPNRRTRGHLITCMPVGNVFIVRACVCVSKVRIICMHFSTPFCLLIYFNIWQQL